MSLPNHLRSLAVIGLIISVLLSQESTSHDPVLKNPPSEFRVGTAIVDITPPVPFRMSGYFSERLSTGIKDRLFAKTVFFEQGKTQAAIVFCDLIGISRQVSQAARARVEQELGVPAQHISIVATHSHTGPLYFGALRKHFHDRRIKTNGEDDFEKVDFTTQLTRKLVDSIKQAKAAVQPVDLHAGSAIEKRLSFNRRFHMKTGGVRFNPGQQNPNIVRVAGPIDPQVGIISFSKPKADKPLGAVIAFALHLDTVGGTEYSADYPIHLQHRLRKSLGADFVSFFGAGTCGDINHVDVTIKGRRSAQEIGSMLGNTVEEKINALTLQKSPSLAVKSVTVDALLQTFSAQEKKQAAADMEKVDTSELSFLKRVHAYKVNAVSMRPGQSIPLEVQAFRLSPDCAIVTLPGEVFVDLGIAIKTASPFKETLVIELANDAPGYIPTRKAFAEGSYETVNSRVQPGYGEKMATAAIRLLKELAISE